MKIINPAISSRQQRNWDWRAAGNFIGGGIGTGLITAAALASLKGFDTLPLMLLGLALVGGGLFCVWLEIGRPWRALNVFKHLSTSWMSREALVAPLLFTTGAAAWLFEPLLLWPTAILALSFLYSQSRILRADKGIPAWRHPRCAQLLIATGLTEGTGLLVLALPFVADAAVESWLLLLALLGVRHWLWQRYRSELAAANAPLASQRQLATLDHPLLWFGTLIPGVLLLCALLVPPLAMVAGALALASGANLKYTLICRAAFTQGFSLQHQPVRGQRTPARMQRAAH